MAKLAMISALLLGACVATDTDEADDVARVTDEVTPIDVVDEVEIPQTTGVAGDYGTVVITGIEIPGRASSEVHIDLASALEVEALPTVVALCPIADTLPNTNVCSSLCDVATFVARINDAGGANGIGCQHQSCLLGDTLLNLEVCAPGDG